MDELTKEQWDVVTSSGDAKVEALAGTGKTTTLVHYARHHQNDGDILYLVFNKAMQESAENKFPKNVKVSTAHSLAWNSLGLNGTKVNGGFDTYDVMRELKLKTGREGRLLAKSTLELFGMYCNSSKETPWDSVADLVEHMGPGRLASFTWANRKKVAQLAEDLFDGMRSRRIEEITFDFYFKRFAQEKAENVLSKYEIVLADEAQDHNEVTARILIDSPPATVFVGDSLQQIYGWRNAVNTLKKVPDYPQFSLTGAFRFGEEISRLVNRVVTNLTGEELSIRGLGPNSEVTTYRADQPPLKRGWTYLSRNNADLIAIAESTLTRGWSMYIEGGVETLRFKVMGLILQLLNGRRPRHPFFSLFSDIEELQDYWEAIDDRGMLGLLGVVRKYRNRLGELEIGIKASSVDDIDRADVVFSTAHKAKGLEFENVALLDNFARGIIDSDEELDLENWRTREEINLLYVAMTRAKRALMVPGEVAEAPPNQIKTSGEVGDKMGRNPGQPSLAGTVDSASTSSGNRSKKAIASRSASTRKTGRFPGISVVKNGNEYAVISPDQIYKMPDGELGVQLDGMVWPIEPQEDGDIEYSITTDRGKDSFSPNSCRAFDKARALNRSGLEPYEESRYEDRETYDPTLIDRSGAIISYRKKLPAYVVPGRQYGVEYMGVVWPIWKAQDDWVVFVGNPSESYEIEQCSSLKKEPVKAGGKRTPKPSGDFVRNCFCKAGLYDGMAKCRSCGWIICSACGGCGCTFSGW